METKSINQIVLEACAEIERVHGLRAHKITIDKQAIDNCSPMSMFPSLPIQYRTVVRVEGEAV